MDYPYSLTNRLKEPHNYMYTPFQGGALLQSYQSSRMAVVYRRAATEQMGLEPDHMLVDYALPVLESMFDAISLEAGKKLRAMLECGSAKIVRRSRVEGNSGGLTKALGKLTVDEPVTTLDLLHALIAGQSTNNQDANAKVWLDRLVQRFEVTKKLYDSYLPGFRKGTGVNTSARLYWLFALALCLFYARTNSMQYLSTLLKVCDLLCSLPEDLLQGQVPAQGLTAVLATEIVSVQLLAEKKGVQIGSE